VPGRAAINGRQRAVSQVPHQVPGNMSSNPGHLRYVEIAAAWLEVVVGALLIVVPEVVSVWLLGAKPAAIGVLFARFGGVGLFGLGIACLPPSGPSNGRSLRGLFIFNIGMTLLLAWVAIATVYRGILVWPATVLHGAIAAALLQRLRALRH
jgi:hypothetical protein